MNWGNTLLGKTDAAIYYVRSRFETVNDDENIVSLGVEDVVAIAEGKHKALVASVAVVLKWKDAVAYTRGARKV